MDKVRVLIDRLAALASLSPAPPLCYAAMQRNRSFNPPAPIAGICYLARGSLGPWTVGGRRVVRPTNHLVVSHSFQGSASPEPEEPIEFWAIAFNLEGVGEFSYLWDTRVEGSVAVRNPARLIAAYQKLSERFLGGPTVDPLLLKAALLDFFGVVRCEFGIFGSASGAGSDAIERALAFMRDQLHNPRIRLADIACAANLSAHHFVRAFKGSIGLSPMRHLREMRMRQSIGLLQATNLSVKEVAFSVGYTDPLHFSRSFHSYTGQSPTAYRGKS